MSAPYAPSRALPARIARRLTQWRAARPIEIAPARPLLSISFDDFPETAATIGAGVLEAHHVRGTYYAAASMEGRADACGPGFTRASLLRLAANGHEIGCHSFAHGDGARGAVRDTLADYAKNADAIAAMGHHAPLRTLAYPYGETTLALKRALPARFVAARGILPGLNLGRTDAAQLRAYPFFGADAFDGVRDALGEAARRKAWLIVFTHDIGAWPSPYGATPKALTALIRAARTLNFDILPVAEAAARAFKIDPLCV